MGSHTDTLCTNVAIHEYVNACVSVITHIACIRIYRRNGPKNVHIHVYTRCILEGINVFISVSGSYVCKYTKIDLEESILRCVHAVS